jgi:hypothetical protein
VIETERTRIDAEERSQAVGIPRPTIENHRVPPVARSARD